LVAALFSLASRSAVLSVDVLSVEVLSVEVLSVEVLSADVLAELVVLAVVVSVLDAAVDDVVELVLVVPSDGGGPGGGPDGRCEVVSSVEVLLDAPFFVEFSNCVRKSEPSVVVSSSSELDVLEALVLLVELVLSVVLLDGGGPGGGPGGGVPAPVAAVLAAVVVPVAVVVVEVLSLEPVCVLSLSEEEVSSVEDALDRLFIIIASHASNWLLESVDDVSVLLLVSAELVSVVDVVSESLSDLLLPLSVNVSNRSLSEVSALVFCFVE
jgi:hypothetical protein